MESIGEHVFAVKGIFGSISAGLCGGYRMLLSQIAYSTGATQKMPYLCRARTIIRYVLIVRNVLAITVV